MCVLYCHMYVVFNHAPGPLPTHDGLLLTKSKVENILTKTVVLCINLKVDDSPITSRSYTHPSHSQTSHHLPSSLYLLVSHNTDSFYLI